MISKERKAEYDRKRQVEMREEISKRRRESYQSQKAKIRSKMNLRYKTDPAFRAKKSEWDRRYRKAKNANKPPLRLQYLSPGEKKIRAKMRAKQAYLKDRARRIDRAKENYRKNREAILAYQKKYFQKNKKVMVEKVCLFRRTNPHAKLRHSISNRLRIALKLSRSFKSGNLNSLIGCTIEELIKYLEAKFQSGMSWENYGEWHVDHKVPCVQFDLSQEAAQKECFHFSNLQPLWAEDNLRKGAKIAA